jgi:ParB family chromosome partitioning protein
MTANKRPGGLGRGLSAILQKSDNESVPKSSSPLNSTSDILLSQIQANPFQPRTEFDMVALEDLARSIKHHGVIQPITVRKVSPDSYEIISGERRTRASRMLGLTTIPAYVRLANDQSMLEMALVENLYREDLNPIEIALSYQRLIEEVKLRHDDVAERVGKSRVAITNILRLLKLPEEIQVALRDNIITAGQARPLLGISDPSLQMEIYEEIINQDLSSRAIEALVKKRMVDHERAPIKPKQTKKVKSNNFADYQQIFNDKFDLPVKIESSRGESGKIIISFKKRNDLEVFLNKFNQDKSVED